MTVTKLWIISLSLSLTFILCIFPTEAKAQMVCYPVYGGNICTNNRTGEVIRSYTQPNGITTITPLVEPRPPKPPIIIDYGCLMALGCSEKKK